MEENRNGEIPLHRENHPKTNIFGCKVTENNSSFQERDEALSSLLSIVNNPEQPQPDKTEIGMLRIKPANQWMKEAKERPDPLPLWLSLWNEGEVCIAFADANLGKSIYGVQISNEIAKHQKVLYFDFELSDKQFQRRYTDESLEMYKFPENFLRGEIDPYLLGCDKNFETAIIEDIEEAALLNECKVVVIDNLTFLTNEAEKGDSAGRLMVNLLSLKKKHGLSILVIAHTPKRALNSPITRNDLAGSKRLINFCDSAFAIGESAKDDRLRYIKQIKCRDGAFEYGSENVLVAEIVKENSFLQFRIIGTSPEKEHLKESTEKEVAKLEEDIRELKGQGESYQKIADQLKLSKSKVFRICKKLNI